MLALTIGGRLGADPTVGNANGTAVLNFNVAVDGWDYKAREKTTTWVRCALFGARGEKLAEHLSKGSHVMVSGQGKLSEYKGKQYLELTANEVTLMGGKAPESAGNKPAPAKRKVDDEEPPF
jgi:single-strand DNA-binding protein